MPILWDRLLLGESRSPQIHLLYDYRLKLSGDRPLTLDVHADRDLNAGELTIISKYADRLEKLIINPRSYIYLAAAIFSQLCEVPFPRLQQFDYCVGSVPGSLLRVVRDVSAGEPFYVPYARHYSRIYWSRWTFSTIARLTLGLLYSGAQPYYMDFWRMLDRCRMTLEVLEYYGRNPMINGEWQGRITFPRLRILVWGYVEDLSPIIYLVRAPKLRELTIRNIVDCPPTSEHDYYPKKHLHPSLPNLDLFGSFTFLYGSDVPRLKALHLIGCKAEYTVLMSFLSFVPELDTLTLYAIKRGHERRNYVDALLEADINHLRKLVTSSGRSWLSHYLKQRMTPLEECVVTESVYKSVEWEELLRGASVVGNVGSSVGKGASNLDLSVPGTGMRVENVWVMKDPVEYEHRPIQPFMQPIVDGMMVVSKSDDEDQQEGDVQAVVSLPHAGESTLTLEL
ncbi:hypothetical protein V5O48_015753 [Marasmius crinis-equi]|uniref:Uncharacterized protein n=1 Tax=Marasmius crinis-equi TaxID=585013 RepID=A0ABR3ETP9_9AGAR